VTAVVISYLLVLWLGVFLGYAVACLTHMARDQ